MSRAVDMAIVALLSLIFNSSCIDGDTTGLFFGRFINLTVFKILSHLFLGEDFSDG